jgi:hypothetical protein
MKLFLVILYLFFIAAANVLTASIPPLAFGPFLVPAGSFLIAATFVLRDLVQNAVGRKRTYAAIGLAMILSAATSAVLGDTLWIVFASAVTFALSETTDTEIYTRLKLPMSFKVLYSGLIGGAVDSVVFILIGMSPLFSGFLPWNAVGFAILGQILVKTALQLAGAACIGIFLEKRPARKSLG